MSQHKCCVQKSGERILKREQEKFEGKWKYDLANEMLQVQRTKICHAWELIAGMSRGNVSYVKVKV